VTEVKNPEEKSMDVTEEALLRSGFTSAELQKIKNNIDSYGGTLEEVIKDLAKRLKRMFF
jgi:hypothetical protein